jgi:hypothetical protein
MQAAKRLHRWFTASKSRFHCGLEELSRAQQKRANDTQPAHTKRYFLVEEVSAEAT